jgi:hypothetical protein
MNEICKTINNHKYIFWSHTEIVREKIWDFLQNTFPDSLVFPELLRADFVIVPDNIPIEIQSTVVSTKHSMAHSVFEHLIERQIKQNIDYFGTCWFFFDSEYLRYLQTELTTGSRINLDWLRQLMKENKLRTFTISHDGIIIELNYKSFDFLSTTSRTCKNGEDNDFRILDRNKFKITKNVLKGYGFTQDIINSSINRHLKRLKSIIGTSLYQINGYLDHEKNRKPGMQRSEQLGIFEITDEGFGVFVDKFEIAEYFPGYIRNKNYWDEEKFNWQNTKQKPLYIKK